MRKSCLIVGGLVIVLLLGCIVGLGGWYAWTRFIRPAGAPETERGHSTMRGTDRRPELPSVEMRLDSASQGRTSSGWPLMVRVSIRCPLSSETQAPIPIIITGRDGSWQESLRVSVEDATGKSVKWPWRMPSAKPGPITLDGRNGLEWIWWLPGADTQSIPPGRYTLRTILDTSEVKATEGWRGKVTSQAVTVAFEPPRKFSPGEIARREILNARVDALGGSNDASLTRLQALTQEQPKNVEALALSASLLAEAGRLEEASTLYGRAIDAWYESSTKPGVEPVALLKARREVRKRLLAQEAQAGVD